MNKTHKDAHRNWISQFHKISAAAMTQRLEKIQNEMTWPNETPLKDVIDSLGDEAKEYADSFKTKDANIGELREFLEKDIRLQKKFAEEYLEEENRNWRLISYRQPRVWGGVINRHWLSAEILYDTALEAKKRNEERRSDDFKARRFESLGNMADMGFLKLEGDVLEKYNLDRSKEELICDYFLMIAYALECAFKGYLLGILPELISDSDLKVERIIFTHDLSDLCKECGMPCSTEEAQLLKFLSFQAEDGKYPAPRYPRKKDDPIPRVPIDYSIPDFPKYDLFAHKAAIDSIIKRACDLLESSRK